MFLDLLYFVGTICLLCIAASVIVFAVTFIAVLIKEFVKQIRK